MAASRGAETLCPNPVLLSRKRVRECQTRLDESAAPALEITHVATNRTLPLRLYLHALLVEDITIQSLLLERVPLFTALLPYPGEPSDDAATLNHYARAVHGRTHTYLGQLPSDGLNRVVDLRPVGLGRRTVAWVIDRFVVAELARIADDISGATDTTAISPR
jgi:hypothetical protein